MVAAAGGLPPGQDVRWRTEAHLRWLIPAVAIAVLFAAGFPALDQYNVTWDEALGDLFFGERYLSFFTSFDPVYLDFQSNPYPAERRPDLFVSPFKIRPWEYYPFANTLAAATSDGAVAAARTGSTPSTASTPSTCCSRRS